jgi:hypothetical protein
MSTLATLLMLSVAACWIAARQPHHREGDGLEWALTSALPATAALLIWLGLHDTPAALGIWLLQLALSGIAALWSSTNPRQRWRPAWRLSSVTVLAAGMLWQVAHTPPDRHLLHASVAPTAQERTR